MFTDVKNVTADQILDLPSIALTSDHKSKGKFHKIFKQLLRILRNTKKKSNTGSIAHPNNVNLNNTSELISIASTIVEALDEAAVTASYEDYAAVIRKAAKDEEFIKAYFAEDPFSDTTAYAFDYSLTKSNQSTACFCSHGHNCQQHHEEFKKYNNYCHVPVAKEISVDDIIVPVHCIRTETGTFFWTAQHTKLDEDLIISQCCNSNIQTAQAQWNNRALL